MGSRSHTQTTAAKKSDVAYLQNQVQSRLFTMQSQAETASIEQLALPDVQTQLETAKQFGHRFTDITHSASSHQTARPSLPLIQPKLTIGAPGDKYEQEADRVAAQVVQQLHAPAKQPASPQALQRESLPEDEELQMQPAISQVQRQESAEEEDEELQMKPTVQRSSGEGTAAPELESAIAQSRNGGQPLGATIRQPMEQAFGADFKGVRVHTDAQSDQMNRSIQAKAFTTKQDIFFRQGAYQPDSQKGQELLAHELTHVVQQSGVRTQQLQTAPETSSSAPVRVLQDTEKPIRRHSDKGKLNEQVETWKSEIAKTLMTDVLNQSDAGAAAQKVYDNMFSNVSTFGWRYRAGFGGRNGAPLIEGSGKEGMCETYRNAFKYMLEQYLIPLTADYDPFAGGFDVQEGQELVSTKFVTNEGLSLLGRSAGYNVDREVNAATGVEKATNRYLFSSHWQLIVNGKTYDPLFQGVDINNIEWVLKSYGGLDGAYKVEGVDVALVEDPSRGPTSGNEFMGHYGLVRGVDAFETSMQSKAKEQDATTQLEKVRSELESVRNKWRDEVCKWYSGKTAWRTPIQETSIPKWIKSLDDVRVAAIPDENSVGGNPLLDRLIVTSRKKRYGKEIAYQIGVAKRALEGLKKETETMNMGEDFNKALEAIGKAKAQATKDEG
jgi:hypothetical protein